MNVINYMIANWDFLLLIVVASAALIFAIFRGNKSVVMRMLYALVTEAEKSMGHGTGALKLASVMETIYPKLPAVIKLFVTEAMLKKWVEEALALAKKSWEQNAAIARYVEPEITEN